MLLIVSGNLIAHSHFFEMIRNLMKISMPNLIEQKSINLLFFQLFANLINSMKLVS